MAQNKRRKCVNSVNLKQSSAKLSWILTEMQNKQEDFVTIVCKVSARIRDKSIIPNDEPQNYPLCKLQLVIKDKKIPKVVKPNNKKTLL